MRCTPIKSGRKLHLRCESRDGVASIELVANQRKGMSKESTISFQQDGTPYIASEQRDAA